jgi:hypothetical protein
MFKGALIGIGIAALSVLPPMIHFVTGPVGPLIGGFVAGSQVTATPRKAVGIGVLMGCFSAAPILVGMTVLRFFFDTFSDNGLGTVLFVAVVVVVWMGILGTCGALLGGYVSRRGNVNRRQPTFHTGG